MDDNNLGFVPDSGFSGAGASEATPNVPHGTPSPDLGFVPDSQEDVNQEKYGGTGQQVIAGLEGAAKGVAGPLATLAETKLLGVKPEDILGRQEANPWTHGLGEAGGFGAGILTGTGEAALVGKAGEAAAGLAGLGEAATTGSKLAKGAVTAATEMGLIQSGDEVSKALLNAPQTPGSVVSNIGLAALLGGVAGPAFTGAGMAASKALDSTGLKEFMDRLAFRKANIDPNEMMRNEAENAIKTYHDMNNEITGSNGLKSQAIAKLLPEMNDKIEGQARGLINKMESTLSEMRSKPSMYPERYISKFEDNLEQFKNSVFEAPPSQTGFDFPNEKYAVTTGNTTELMDEPKVKGAYTKYSIDKVPVFHEPVPGEPVFPEQQESKINLPAGGNVKSPNDIFNGIQDLKKNLQDYSKGNWGPFAIPSHHEAYDFLNTTKNLSREARTALEDSNVWGKAADIQKELNSSWTKALPAAKDFEKKFMTKVGDQLEISGDKFNTYSRQGLKSTTTTDRQKMLGNWIDAMDNHFKTVDKIYEAAGVENPFPSVGMGMLKESIEKPSLGSRLADMWHDKLGPSALGNTAGALVGGKAGSLFGHGLEGVYVGREVLGPIFSNMLKPILEKYPNVDIGAFQQAMSVAKNIQKGNSNLASATSSLFAGASKTFPSHVLPSAKDIEKLDEKTKTMGDDTAQLTNVSGKTGYYLPGHETTIAKAAGDAIQYINSQRPMPTKALPLDGAPTISTAQKEAFKRTLTIAQQPLVAIKHIKDGTLIPQDVATIRTLYPEFYEKMNQQMMTSLTEHIHDGGTVPYKLKQSMSLFLGQPLDSTMTPQSIQSTQSVFMPKQPMQAAGQPKKNTSKLSKVSDSYLTQNQAAAKRQKTDA